MKTLNKKLLVLLGAMFIAGSASAETKNATITTTLNVAPGCIFKESNYSANFGVISPGQVGNAMVTVTTICTDGMPYMITPVLDEVMTDGGPEQAVVRLFTSEDRTTQITLAQPLTAGGNNGGHPLGSSNIYLRVNGTGDNPDFGQGPVLVEPQEISVVVPIIVSF